MLEGQQTSPQELFAHAERNADHAGNLKVEKPRASLMSD